MILARQQNGAFDTPKVAEDLREKSDVFAHLRHVLRFSRANLEQDNARANLSAAIMESIKGED